MSKYLSCTIYTMSTSIEQILATPDKKKETEYSLITTVRKDRWRGVMEAKKALTWWEQKPDKKQLKKEFIINKQCTPIAEEREKRRWEKRLTHKI